MGDVFDVAEPHRKYGLGSFEDLNLTLLIDAKHHGFVRRIEMEPDHVAQLLDKAAIGREFEAASAARLQPEELEQAMNGAFGNARLFGDRAHAPMGGSIGLASKCLGDHLGHSLILNRAGPVAPHLVVESLDPICDEAIAPFADRMRADTKPRRHDGIARLTFAGQHDLCPQRQRRRERARPCDGRELRTFVTRNRQRRLRPSVAYRAPPSIRVPETNAIITLRTCGTEH